MPTVCGKLTCGEGNVFRNCIAINNCDDGWDLYTKKETGAIGVVTLENCQAIGNGYDVNGKDTGGDGNGYKLEMTPLQYPIYL